MPSRHVSGSRFRATHRLIFPGGEIIWEDPSKNIRAFRKRGKEVVASVLRGGPGFGLLGSDVVEEVGFDGTTQGLGAVRNSKGQLLRFCLIAMPNSDLNRKLQTGESLQLVTSYPQTARRLLGENTAVIPVTGGVEAEIRDRAKTVDGGFELVMSGDTVSANGLEVVEDDILPVYLTRIDKTVY